MMAMCVRLLGKKTFPEIMPKARNNQTSAGFLKEFLGSGRTSFGQQWAVTLAVRSAV
ncbi:MAG TPA: hypothetical protein VEC36_03260 [Patescibacteria group bacterium]|nr:hypothetical protein [Patescibacteria group bacterium]